MTKEQFIEQMLEEVTSHKERLEQAELHRVRLDEDVVGISRNPKFNPFLNFDSKYFNIKLLSNLQGLNSVIHLNPDLNVYQTKMFIVCNQQFKMLNEVLKYNPYMVEELKEGLNSPLDIAICYARHCQAQDRFQNL